MPCGTPNRKSTVVRARDIIRQLALKPLRGEGGYYRETWRGLPADRQGRAAGTAIYYLLTPRTFSALHRLPFDEVYHFYLGEPVTMLLLYPGGFSAIVTLGPEITQGEQVQLVVPAGVWQGSRLRDGRGFALLGTTMAPGFDLQDLELGSRQQLLRGWPEQRQLITQLTRSAPGQQRPG